MSVEKNQLNTDITSDFDGNEDRFLADLAFALAAIGREMYAEEQAAERRAQNSISAENK
jgi:DNA invertase Pin-like site-specific DNA recombinase